MKLAIISDTHDNLANIKKALGIMKKEKVAEIIHCGDVCAPSTLKEIAKSFSGKIHLVFGNVDGDHYLETKISYTEFKNIIVYGDLGEMEIEGRKIAFCHLPEFARGLASENKYDLVFYGHTHKPWEEKIGKTRLINPGTLAGMFYKASFAIYDTKKDKLDLKIL